MKKINLKVTINLDFDGLSENELEKINAFFKVSFDSGYLEHKKVIDFLQIHNRPCLVTHIGRKKLSEGFDSATIDLVC